MSKVGFRFLKELFPVGRPIDVNTLRDKNLNMLQINQIKSLTRSVPKSFSDCIASHGFKCTVLYPFQTVTVNG